MNRWLRSWLASVVVAAGLFLLGPGPLSAQDGHVFARGQVGYSVYGWDDRGETVQLQIGHAWPSGIEVAAGADLEFSRQRPLICPNSHRCPDDTPLFSELELWRTSVELRGTRMEGTSSVRPQLGLRASYVRRVDVEPGHGFSLGPLLGLEWTTSRRVALTLTTRLEFLRMVGDELGGDVSGIPTGTDVSLGFSVGARVLLE